ncbi:MAG: 6-phosphogluconolactonase [Thalassolituus sp.]|jgi:6-phosphogluconolactonase|uniref:6-phosphogluconolactonase n=1 Tax=Thalassolituus TaxID=187492 RepID=UPI0023F49922|nr:6-phosphogluconolactonase [Thalassolituus oleivorans]
MSGNRFKRSDVLAKQLADDLAERMAEAIEVRGRVCIAVSGGSTPIRFFEELSTRDIPWQKVLITLVDERWVDEDNAASNARLVREHLLKNKAASAYFLPLKNRAKDPVSGFMECENKLHELMVRLDFAVLGMGNDGHTASWFPDSDALSKCLNEGGAAWCCPVIDEPIELPRMTLTWGLLSNCRHLYLHFEGADKNAVYEQATEKTERQNIAAMPVRTLLYQSQVPLSIYRSE